MPLARAALLVLALVVCAWFALGIRQAHDTSQATAILSAGGGVSSAQAPHVDSLLRAAKTLNPDSQVDLLRGRLAVIENDRPRAVQILEDVVRREPMNLQGWLLLAEASRNVPEIRRAVANLVKLDPRLVPPRR